MAARRRPSSTTLRATAVPAIILLIALGSLALTLYGSGQLPPGLHEGAAEHGLLARQALGAGGTLFAEADRRSPILAGLIALTGRLSGFDVLTIRLAAGLAGAGTVAFSALWLRRLFGPGWGIAGGLLAAGSVWVMLFSRLGLSPIAGSLVTAGLLWLMTEALTRSAGEATPWYVAAGLVGGVGLLADPPLRLLPLVLLIALVGVTLARPIGQDETRIRGLLTTLLVAGVVIALYIRGLSDDPAVLGFWLPSPGLPGDYVASVGTALRGYGEVLLRLIWPGERMAPLNLPDAAVFGLPVVPWALLGLGVLLARVRRPLVAVGLVSAAILLLPAALVEPVHPGRLLVVLPLLLALPVAGMRTTMCWARERRLAPIALLLIALTLTGTIGWSWWTVQAWADEPATAHALSAGVVRSLDAVAGLPGDEPVLYSTYAHQPILDYLAPDDSRRIDFDGRQVLPIFAEADGFLLVPAETPLHPALLSAIGGLPTLEEHADYTIYRVDGRARDRLPLGVPTNRYTDGVVFLGHRLEAQAGGLLQVVLAWSLPGDGQVRSLRLRLESVDGTEASQAEVRLPGSVMDHPYYLLRVVTLQAPPVGTTADLELTLLDRSGQPVQGEGVNLRDGTLFLNRYQFVQE